MTIGDKLSEFVDGIKDLIKDLTTIDVATYTGDVTLDLTGSGLDATRLFDGLKAQASGKLKMVAMTHVDFDMDASNFVAGDVDPKLVELHNGSVKAAIEARNAVVDLIKGLVNIKI